MVNVTVDRRHPTARIDACRVMSPHMTPYSGRGSTLRSADMDNLAVIAGHGKRPRLTLESPGHLAGDICSDRGEAVQFTRLFGQPGEGFQGDSHVDTASLPM